VHLRGETDAPATTPVWVQTPWDMRSTTVPGGVVYIEGVSWDEGGGTSDTALVNLRHLPACDVVVSRCTVGKQQGFDTASFDFRGDSGSGAAQQVLLDQCWFRRVTTSSRTHLAFFSHTASRVVVTNCRFAAPSITVRDSHPGLLDPPPVAVYGNQLADGYGPAWGEYLNPALASPGYLPFALPISAAEQAAGLLPSQWRVRLFREQPDGEIEPRPFRTLIPSATTGRFEGLPGTRDDGQPQRYRIDWWGPAGEAHGAHGLYVPLTDG
jgi:hypothetical protein